MKPDSDWWCVTSLHEAAHGMAAFALECQPLELELNRRTFSGSSQAGCCIARFEKTWFGEVAKIYVTNAPFAAHQHPLLPCGDKGDLHERQEAYFDFSKMIGGKRDNELFRKCVDDPLITFFGDSDIQAAVLVLSAQLYANNKVSLKQVNYWKTKLNIPEKPCEVLRECCLNVARVVSGK